MPTHPLSSFLLAGALGLSLSVHAADPDARAYYGDPANDLVYVIDLDRFALHQVYDTGAGSGPYPVDHAGSGSTYISTRGVPSISVINDFDLSQPLQEIPLLHHPRSTTYNPRKGLALVSGADIALTSVIETDDHEVERVVGDGSRWDPAVNTDFGGTLATGHPFWDKGKRFFQLNRAQRRIELYNHHGRLLDTLETPSTAHHLLRVPGKRHTYLASLEGNPAAGIGPGILKFRVRGKHLKQIAWRELDCAECDPAHMGGHHADLTPDGRHIFMGSTEGHVFVLDSGTLDIVAVIDSGKGSGHTRFVPARHLAIVTNHKDTFITLIDIDTLHKVADIPVTDACPFPGRKSQGHTTGLSPDSRYFYMAASCAGELVRLDLDSYQLERLDVTAAAEALGVTPTTGTAYPVQGAAYVW